MKVYGFSRSEFIDYLVSNNITDSTVENFKEEFLFIICFSKWVFNKTILNIFGIILKKRLKIYIQNEE